MKHIVIGIIALFLAVGVNAQSQRNMEKNFKADLLPADFRSSTLVIISPFKKQKWNNDLDEIMKLYKGKYAIVTFQEFSGAYKDAKYVIKLYEGSWLSRTIPVYRIGIAQLSSKIILKSFGIESTDWEKIMSFLVKKLNGE